MRTVLAIILLFALPGGLGAQSAAAPPEHTLRPGDILKVDVWGHADYSGTFIVDETGRLRYPVIGDIDARALTINALRERLRTGLEQLFRSAFVTVTPLFRMSVLGEVRSPGLFTVDPTLSVLDVVAMAGGPIPGADMNKIRLMRGGEVLSLSYDRGGSLQEMGVRSGDQIFVPRKAFTAQTLNTLFTVVQIGLSVAILVTTVNR
jgi:polysaccharide export outer membrane protein